MTQLTGASPARQVLRTSPRESRSLRHQVAAALRQAIVSGELPSGARLVEEELSRQMETSRGPVREALRQLEQEGLVVSFPYRATVVAEISAKEAREVLIPVRLALERFAFRHAMRFLDEGDFAELASLVAAMERSAGAGDLAGLVEGDVRFHELVVRRSDQPHTTQLWQAISSRIRSFFFRMGPRHRNLAEIADEHRELLAALRSGDEEVLLGVLDRHIVDPLASARADEGRRQRRRR